MGAIEIVRERLARWHDNLLQARIPPYIQPELFHYTNVEGLHGIIKSNRIWASSALYMNDSSEVEYGWRLVFDVIGEWLNKNAHRESPPPLSLLVLRYLGYYFFNSPYPRPFSTGIYVACFCKDGDLLSQWRAYGQAGGYSIGMLSSELEIGLLSPGMRTTLLEVEYDPQKQRKIVHSTLKSFIEEVEQARLEEHGKQDYLFEELGIVLAEVLLDRIVGFKHQAFQGECEWRLVTRSRLSSLHHDLRQDEEKREPDLKYRTSKGMLIPFVEIEPLGEGILPIRTVRIGPSLNKAKAESGLMRFLVQHNHGRVKVLGCDTPVQL